ncbi:MAG: glycosyltransferase family 2 protein [Chloroflexia bacterium]|nr:glycosyltransferase family 2 protein [Chloroflexia bacterium]
MQLNLSILIPVFNGLDFTKKCLADLENVSQTINNELIKLNTIVIDDGSKDGTSEWINKNYPYVHVLKGNGNLWWSGGINAGIRFALENLDSNYFLLWNNDIKPNENYFQHIFDFIQDRPECSIFCSSIYFLDKPDTLISTGGYFNRKNGKKL